MENGVRCHPLNIIDDYSRMNLCCEPLLSEAFAEVKPCMERVFGEYGLLFSFLCDNGNPWGAPQSMRYTNFDYGAWSFDFAWSCSAPAETGKRGAVQPFIKERVP